VLHFHDRATIQAALTLDLEPALRRLLTDRVTNLRDDLIDWTEYLIVQPGDTEADIVRHIGSSPLVEPFDGVRFGQPGFHPHWDWLQLHDGWFEMILTFGSTFAYILLIQDADGVPADLLRLCRRHAGEPT